MHEALPQESGHTVIVFQCKDKISVSLNGLHLTLLVSQQCVLTRPNLVTPNLLDYRDRLFRFCNRMPNNSFILIDLIIIPSLERLVAEKVNIFKAFSLEMLETIRFVPSGWKDVKANLTADGVSQS
jgi:hypothetical protein